MYYRGRSVSDVAKLLRGVLGLANRLVLARRDHDGLVFLVREGTTIGVGDFEEHHQVIRLASETDGASVDGVVMSSDFTVGKRNTLGLGESLRDARNRADEHIPLTIRDTFLLLVVLFHVIT